MRRFVHVLAALLAVALGVGLAFSCRAEEFFGQKLMVDQHNNVYPDGSVLGLSAVAELAASNKVAQAKIDAVQEVQASTSREVDLVVGTLTGVNAYGYVEDFVESLGGVSSVSTNATCHIAKFEIGAKKEIIDGVSYSAQELYFYFSEPMNQTPYVTFMPSLEGGATNEWEKMELQDVTYLGTATIDGIEYENAYKAEVWTLTELDKCFYRVQCEISAPMGDGTTFDVLGGLTVSGEKGDTGEYVCMGPDDSVNVLVYKGGVLMRVENYTSAEWAAKSAAKEGE